MQNLLHSTEKIVPSRAVVLTLALVIFFRLRKKNVDTKQASVNMNHPRMGDKEGVRDNL